MRAPAHRFPSLSLLLLLLSAFSLASYTLHREQSLQQQHPARYVHPKP